MTFDKQGEAQQSLRMYHAAATERSLILWQQWDPCLEDMQASSESMK